MYAEEGEREKGGRGWMFSVTRVNGRLALVRVGVAGWCSYRAQRRFTSSGVRPGPKAGSSLLPPAPMVECC